MLASTICYPALVPRSGFRWIYRESDGRWKLCDPPDDWPETDNQFSHPALSERFFLAASLNEFAKIRLANNGLGPLISEPNLLLKFASIRKTPSAILELANTYGLLRYSNFDYNAGRITIERDDEIYENFVTAFPGERTHTVTSIRIELDDAIYIDRYGEIYIERDDGVYEYIGTDSPDERTSSVTSILNDERSIRTISLEEQPSETCQLYAEPAYVWIQKHYNMNQELEEWATTQASGDVERIDQNRDIYNTQGGSLTFQTRMDQATGQPYGSLIATSFQSMLDVQYGMLLVAGTATKQCEECPTWIAIAPGSGRPDKKYCSDACRMRGYRKRKTQGTRPKSQTNSLRQT